MTQFASQSPNLTSLRSFTQLPKASRLIEQDEPEVFEPTPVKASTRSLVSAAQLESAITVNRSNTPQELVDKRSAPRYSIREINTLTPEQIRDRLSKINPSDDRPGWVKTLDIIDMPRNFIQNVITDEFVPEAKRMAMERGEFDQAGQVKVYGSDILRAMGVRNRAITAIGGFAADVFTDPLSFIGGPIGGLKTVGARGASQLSVKGRRGLNSAINSYRQSGLVANGDAANLIKAVIDDAVESGAKIGDTLVAEADRAAQAQYLREAILGSTSKAGNAAEKFGLGRFSRGGFLADDPYTVITNKRPAEAARISAVKEYVSRYANNGVFDFTRGKGGAEIAHIPFIPSSTVTVPAFKVPGTNMRFGQQAVLQKAAAAVREGKPMQAESAIKAVAHTNYVSKLTNEIEQLSDQITDAARAGDSAYDELIEKSLSLRQELRDAIVGGKAFREASPGNIKDSFDSIEDLGTLFATMDNYESAAVQARHAEKLANWSDIQSGTYRANRNDINKAREHYNMMEAEAVGRFKISPEEFYDAVLNPSRHEKGLNDLIELRISQAGDRYRDLIKINEDDLAQMEAIADGLSEHIAASHHVANIYQTSIRHAMHKDAGHLADAAKMMLNLSDADTGHLPLGKMADMLQAIGATTASSRMRDFGEKIAINLGGVKGNIPDIMRHERSVYSNATHRAAEIANTYRDQIETAIRKSSNVSAADYDIVAELAGLRLEQKVLQKVRSEIGPISRRYDQSIARTGSKIDDAIKNGVLQDRDLLAVVDELAESASDLFVNIGKEAMLRGDFENPVTAYMPLVLKREAVRRARLRKGLAAKNTEDATGIAGSSAQLDPTQQRITDIVEFTDLNGKQHAFTIAEANAYKGLDDGTLGAMQGVEKTNAQATKDGIEAFRETFKSKATGEKLIDEMRRISVAMTPDQANEYAASRRLDPITGGAIREGKDGRDFFETNIVQMVYNRLAANEVARAKEGIRDIVDEFAVVRIGANDYNKLVAGEKATLATGEEAINLGDGRIKIAGTVYTRIDSLQGRFGTDTIFDPSRVLKAEHGDAFIPETLATEMARVADTLRPEKMPEILQTAERITSMFRTTTLMHPSWMATNAVGNTILAALHGSFSDPKRTAKFVKYVGAALRAHVRRNADSASQLKFFGRNFRSAGTKFGTDPNTTIMLGGGPVRIGDILQLADDNGVTGASRAADVLQQMMAMNARDLPGMADPITGAGIRASVGREVSRRRAGRKSTKLQKGADVPIAWAQTAPTEMYRKAVGTWFGANGTVDDVFRTAFFMQQLDDGNDAITAAANTRRAMLNFGDMSSFEKNTLRPLIPFYAWMRASLPNFVMKGIKDPKLLSAVPKIQQGLEEAAAGEHRLPRHMRPSWLQETMAIQLGTDPEARKAVLAGTLLPQEGALQVATAGAGALAAITDPDGSFLGFDGNDFMEGVNWIFGQSSPVAKIPIEIAQGKEIFSKRDIGVRPGEGDITLKDYLYNQVRPIKEYGLGIRRGEIQKQVEEQGIGAGAGRLLIGGRLQTGLQEEKRLQSLWFELSDKENTIRKAIRAAEKSGDEERVVKLKIQLLGEYKKFVEKGGNPDDLPRWARDDLAQFTQ